MERAQFYSVKKLFLHVTHKRNKNSIFENGIYQSEDGTWGEGVYCVEHWDKHSLLTILNSELYTDNGYTLEDLTIIEFEYTGEYIIFTPQMRIYNNERFILIKEPIDKTKITEIKASIEYLKHIN
jgi:hypothetical protein